MSFLLYSLLYCLLNCLLNWLLYFLLLDGLRGAHGSWARPAWFKMLLGLGVNQGGGPGDQGRGPLGGLGKLPTPQAGKGQSGKHRTVVRQAKGSQASKGPFPRPARFSCGHTRDSLV